MKKNNIITFLAVILFALFIVPITANAEVEVTNLKEAVDEEIQTFGSESSYADAVKKLESYDLSSYKDSKDKVNVYIFRGSTCSHCFEAIDHFASIYAEDGKYFNVKTYEVWSNSDNNEIMEKVAKKLGDEVSGVPYIVIGDKSWSGYAASYDTEMMSKIKSEYKKSNAKRYDVIKQLNGKGSSSSSAGDIVAVLVIILVVAGITFGIIATRKNATK